MILCGTRQAFDGVLLPIEFVVSLRYRQQTGSARGREVEPMRRKWTDFFRRLPLPGLRILKTGIAVLLCLYIDLLRPPGALPFYSCIATILCMQSDPSLGRKTGEHRMLATLIGGVYGYLMILSGQGLGIRVLPALHYAFIAVAVMLLIYITVLLRQQRVAYLACVVALSISLSHGGDPDPLGFAVNRVLDTVIGIGVALIVNAIPFLRNRKLDQ